MVANDREQFSRKPRSRTFKFPRTEYFLWSLRNKRNRQKGASEHEHTKDHGPKKGRNDSRNKAKKFFFLWTTHCETRFREWLMMEREWRSPWKITNYCNIHGQVDTWSSYVVRVPQARVSSNTRSFLIVLSSSFRFSLSSLWVDRNRCLYGEVINNDLMSSNNGHHGWFELSL